MRITDAIHISIMANMSYCRFENTYEDLYKCLDALDDLKLSESEYKYAKYMRTLCEKYVERFDDLEDEIEII